MLLTAAAPCPDIFSTNSVPVSPTVSVLCNRAYAAGYSSNAREPLWVAEHLTEESLEQAEALPGRGSFHADLRLPAAARSELADFKRSGWTRGHLAPSADAPTRSARGETFLLSNVVPQTDRLNSGRWNEIERNVRTLTEREGEAYVVTGPAFREDLGTIGRDHVRVPSSLWKAVYVPSLNQVAVVVCRNTTPFQCTMAPMDALKRIAGINPFPGLAAKESETLARSLLP